MCLRAEEGAVIANKTVLKMMREMGIRCGIRRETAYHRYNSYKGVVGRTFENVIARDFDAGAPWQKLGTAALATRWKRSCAWRWRLSDCPHALSVSALKASLGRGSAYSRVPLFCGFQLSF